jgi:hypothetical protein
LTFFAFSLLLAFSIRARNKASYLWEKAGFGFIILSAVFGLFIYIFLALDRVITLITDIPHFTEGYSILTYFGWVSAIFMTYFGYAGYVMPNRIREWYRKKEESQNG